MGLLQMANKFDKCLSKHVIIDLCSFHLKGKRKRSFTFFLLTASVITRVSSTRFSPVFYDYGHFHGNRVLDVTAENYLNNAILYKMPASPEERMHRSPHTARACVGARVTRNNPIAICGEMSNLI